VNKSKNEILNYLNPLALYNPKLPAGRIKFLWGLIYPIILIRVIATLANFIELVFGFIDESPIMDPLVVPVSILFLIALMLIQIRRLKDIGKSGWFVLIVIIPVINILYFIWILFAKGTVNSTPSSDIIEPQKGDIVEKMTTSASTKCPYCGSLVLENATECTHCTAKIDTAPTSISLKNQKKKQLLKLNRKSLFLGAIFIIAIFITFLYLINQNNYSESKLARSSITPSRVPPTFTSKAVTTEALLNTSPLSQAIVDSQLMSGAAPEGFTVEIEESIGISIARPNAWERNVDTKELPISGELVDFVVYYYVEPGTVQMMSASTIDAYYPYQSEDEFLLGIFDDNPDGVAETNLKVIDYTNAITVSNYPAQALSYRIDDKRTGLPLFSIFLVVETPDNSAIMLNWAVNESMQITTMNTFQNMLSTFRFID
jgi:uncharacterized membrane protein YhaH (DUF805 family)